MTRPEDDEAPDAPADRPTAPEAAEPSDPPASDAAADPIEAMLQDRLQAERTRKLSRPTPPDPPAAEADPIEAMLRDRLQAERTRKLSPPGEPPPSPPAADDAGPPDEATVTQTIAERGDDAGEATVTQTIAERAGDAGPPDEATVTQTVAGRSQPPAPRPAPGPASGRSSARKDRFEGRSFGPFSLKRRIASGGLSAVFLGVDTRDGERVALKMFRPEVSDNPELVWLAERSLALTRQLAHPNLVRIKDGGVIDRRRYTSMEYLEGRTLAQELALGPLDAPTGLNVLSQLLDATAVIHEAGMAHRDLKPANVLLVPTGREAPHRFRATILDLDFLGPVDNRRLSRTRELLGTPKYMAPEDIHRGYPHPRSDIFSLGVVAYELFTGREPFRVESEVGYLHANRLEQAPPMREHRPELPPELDAFVAGMLAKQPDERYDARSALRDCTALAGAAPGAPVRLGGPPPAPRTSAQLTALATVSAMLPLVLFIALLARPRGLAAMATLGAPRIALVPPPAPPQPVVVPAARPWPQSPRSSASAAALRWRAAALALERDGLPGARAGDLERLAAIAGDRRQRYAEAASQRLVGLLERRFRELRELDPDSAERALERARGLASDAAEATRLAALLAAHRRARAEALARPRAPAGAVIVKTGPRRYAAVLRRPISNIDYLAFLRANPTAPRPPGWSAVGFPVGEALAPVRGLRVATIALYAGWRRGRLASEQELSLAAEGGLQLQPSEWQLGAKGPAIRGVQREAQAAFRLAFAPDAQLKRVEPPTPRHRLEVASYPAGAQVFVGGQAVGRAPLEVPLYGSGKVVIKLVLPRREPWIDHIEPLAARVSVKGTPPRRSTLPPKGRDFREDADARSELIREALKADADDRDERKQAHSWMMLLYDHKPDDLELLLALRRHLEPLPRPLLKREVAARIDAIEARAAAIRKRGGEPAELWKQLAEVGLTRRARMVFVPAGTFKAGVGQRLRTDEDPVKTIRTGAYWIDRTEVTNRAYLRYVQATGVRPPGYWRGGKPKASQLDHPVHSVTLAQAKAYARWMGKRLPSEHAWERAARGDLFRKYPWGDNAPGPRSRLARVGGVGTTKVGSYPRGESPFGCLDMAGNVAEWTVSPMPTDFGAALVIIKGGSYSSAPLQLRIGARRSQSPTVALADVGFRCIAAPAASDK